MSNSMQLIKTYFDNPNAQSKLTQLVPRGVEAGRLMRMALMSISKTPKLQECTPESLFMAVCDAAALGLDCGGSLGSAYLVPYKEKCTLIVGYRGMVQLCRQSGDIATVEARVVYEGDEFNYEFGIQPVFRHRPCGRTSSVQAAWAMAKFKDKNYQLEVMSRDEIEKIRGRSKAAQSGPWITDYAEMCKKTVVRRLCKMLPMSLEAVEAIDRLDTAEFDLQERRNPQPTLAAPTRQERLTNAIAETNVQYGTALKNLADTKPARHAMVESIQKAVDGEIIEPGANDGAEDLSPPADFVDPKSDSSGALLEIQITPKYLNDKKGNRPHSIKTADGEYFSTFSDSLWAQVKEIGCNPMIVTYEDDGKYKTIMEVRPA